MAFALNCEVCIQQNSDIDELEAYVWTWLKSDRIRYGVIKLDMPEIYQI